LLQALGGDLIEAQKWRIFHDFPWGKLRKIMGKSWNKSMKKPMGNDLMIK